MPRTQTASSGGTGRAAKAAEARRRILVAAAELFSESDYEAVQVAEIARRAGVAHGLLFHHFGNKRGLYLAAMREAAEKMQQAFEGGLEGTSDEMIASAFRSHVTYLRDHRGLALRLVLGGRGVDPEAWEVFEGARWRGLHAVAGILGFDLGAPTLRMLARAGVGAIDEAVAVWLTDDDSTIDVDEMVALIMRIISALFRAAAESTSEPTLAARLLEAADLVHPGGPPGGR